MLPPHSLFEILACCDKIDKIQQYSILTSKQGKQDIVGCLATIRTLINGELETIKTQLQARIQEHQRVTSGPESVDDQRRGEAGNQQDGNAPSIGNDSHDRAESNEQSAVSDGSGKLD